MSTFVIAAIDEKDDDGHPLFWSNDDGWVSLDTATVFGDTAGLNLPVGGEWQDEDAAWERANELNNGCCECGETGHSCNDCPTFTDAPIDSSGAS